MEGSPRAADSRDGEVQQPPKEQQEQERGLPGAQACGERGRQVCRTSAGREGGRGERTLERGQGQLRMVSMLSRGART